MTHPLVRAVLVVLALAAMAGAGYYAFDLEARATAQREAARAFDQEVARLQVTLGELRASQAAYLAQGQDPSVWMEKTAKLREQAEARLRSLIAAATSQEVEGDLAAAAEAIASFGRFDGRVREVLQDNPQEASKLVFSDASQVLAGASRSLAAARQAESARASAPVARQRAQELYALVGAAGFVLVVLFVLAVAPRRPTVAPEDQIVEDPEHAAGRFRTDGIEPAPIGGTESGPARPDLGVDLDLAMERRKPAAEASGGPEAVAGAERLPDDATRRGLAERRDQRPAGTVLPDLGAAASLCTDLARVHDTSELQGLLARAATLLDASGIVIWMGGEGGTVLWPAFSHGYSPHALAKMQALPCDGATAVSMAFRKRLMQVVPAGDQTSGALVAPILTAAGCVGAMAVEIRHGAESSEGEQALASIIAAQLATLVAGENAN